MIAELYQWYFKTGCIPWEYFVVKSSDCKDFWKVYSCFWIMLYLARGFPGGSYDKESACNAGDMGSIPGSERSLEKGMATRFSVLAWRIPWTDEPDGLQSWGLKESDMTEQLTLHTSCLTSSSRISSIFLFLCGDLNFWHFYSHDGTFANLTSPRRNLFHLLYENSLILNCVIPIWKLHYSFMMWLREQASESNC